MSEYKYQAKATREFGIEFRSKLEATWAYALAKLKHRDETPLRWDYVDSPWHDFVLHLSWGDAKVEIKPVGDPFMYEAILRMPDDEVLFIAQGQPGKVSGFWVEGVWPICVHRFGKLAFLINAASVHEFRLDHMEAMSHAARGWPYSAEFLHISIIEECLKKGLDPFTGEPY
jgi:hypothetical protein